MLPTAFPVEPVFEPRLARVAAAIADPTRARTLARLLDGRLHSAGELASHAGVTPATMSAHLKLLVDEGLARVREQGRHRYFGLADGNVGHALEALMQVAEGPANDMSRWQRPAMKGLRHARTCYGHMAGELGVRLHDTLLQKGWACPAPQGGYALTAEGIAALSAAGLSGLEPDQELPSAQRLNRGGRARRSLYDCVDWSERRDHFAGSTASAILDACIEKGWLKQHTASRELIATPIGQKKLIDGLLAAP